MLLHVVKYSHATHKHKKHYLRTLSPPDHFENLYAVVRGTKVFHLLPPSDVYRMYIRQVTTGGAGPVC